jgi:hypothetical protein
MTTFLIAFISVSWPLIVMRVVAIGVSLFLWFWTQKLIARRGSPAVTPESDSLLTDGSHVLTTGRIVRLLWTSSLALSPHSTCID